MGNAAADYPFGQCTWYVASRFPDIYGYMGNAKEWVNSALRQGYQVSSVPVPDSIAVFAPGGSGQYSSDGHVAVVDSVNSDGTFNVSEMNYGGFGQVDTRRTTSDHAIGFIIPPGSQYTGPIQQYTPGGQLQFASSTSGGCITSWGIFGANICMDGIVGGAACAAGGFLMLGGVLVLVAVGFQQSGAARMATRMAGPAGKTASWAMQPREQTRKQQATEHQERQRTQAEEHQQAVRRAQLRTARARARGAEAQARASRGMRVAA